MVLAILILLQAQLAAAPPAIQPELQAALLKRIFSYDRTLNTTPARKTRLLVAQKQDHAASAKLVEALNTLKIEASVVNVSDLEAAAASVEVIYFMPGADDASTQRLCEKHGILSVSAKPEPVESGAVTLNLGVNDEGRPQILINLKRMKTERHDFSSDLLQLAKIYGK